MSEQQSEVVTDHASIGRELRRAREALGQSIQDVADAIKLNPRQVVALEQERFDELPGRAFVRGFLRNYARHLGIDAERLLGTFDQADGTGRTPDALVGPSMNTAGPITLGGTPRRRTSGGGWGAILLGLLVLGGVGWHFDWFSLRTTEPGAEGLLVAEPAPAAVTGQTSLAVAPPAAQAAAPATATVVTPAAPAAVSSLVTDSTAAAGTASAVAETTPPTVMAAAGTGDAATTETSGTAPASGDADAAAPATPGGNELVFTLSGESWMQVRDANGATLYMGTSGAGTTRTVSGKAPFSLVIGNATNVKLQRGGVPVDLAPHTRGSVARLTLP